MERSEKEEVKEVKVEVEVEGEEKVTEIGLDVSACPIERVTAYSDRAETVRRVEISPKEAGLYSVKIQGFSKKINQSTIRVLSQDKAITISEVNSGTSTAPPPQQIPAQNSIRIGELTTQLKAISSEIQRLNAEEKWLSDHATSQAIPHLNPEHKLELLTLESAEQLMQLFRSNLTRLSNRKLELEGNKKKVNDEIAVLSKIPPSTFRSQYSTEINIDVVVHKPKTVSLELSYIIMDCSWTSSYDIKVDTNQEDMCKLIYYASITNSTDEDWKDILLFLSTAEPSVGGTPPNLFPIHVQFNAPNMPKIRSFFRNSSAVQSLNSSMSHSAEDSDHSGSDSGSDSGSASGSASGSGSGSGSYSPPPKKIKSFSKKKGVPPPPQPKQEPKQEDSRNPIQELTSTVDSGALSSTYQVKRKATIISDGKPHKVTITHLNLSARFEHVCVPTQTTDAYFRAITTNTSSYRLLQGPMNVYMNNFFIASSNLRETGPKEVFKLYLGIDDGIKVEHQPNVLAEKEQGGMPFGRKTKLETTTLTTIIKNLKDTPVRVLVFYQKPFTSNADLKIKIEEPRTSNNPEVKVDEFNILSFENVIPPKKDYTCSFKYSMEYPVELKLTSTPQRGVKGEMRI